MIWILFFTLLAVLCCIVFEVWVSFVKKRIYQLFEADKEKWWFYFYLQKEVRAPIEILSFALIVIDKEVGLERTVIPVVGMRELSQGSLIPVMQSGYRLDSSGGSRREWQDEKKIIEKRGKFKTVLT